jgi:hypothetical protein
MLETALCRIYQAGGIFLRLSSLTSHVPGSSHQKQGQPDTDTKVGAVPKYKTKAPVIIIVAYINDGECVRHCTNTCFYGRYAGFNLAKGGCPV